MDHVCNSWVLRRVRWCLLFRCCLNLDMGVVSGFEGRHRMGGVEGAIVFRGWWQPKHRLPMGVVIVLEVKTSGRRRVGD